MSATPTGQTEAADADRKDASTAQRGTAFSVRRMIFLAALAAAQIAALRYGFDQEGVAGSIMPQGSVLLWLVAALPAICAVAAGVARLGNRPARWARLIRAANAIPSIWFVLSTACVVSFVIAQTANMQPPPSSYWGLFAVWLVVVASIVAWAAAGFSWRELRPAAVRGQLLAHRGELAAVVALTAAAAALRMTNLTTLPLPFEQDEAALAHESLYVIQGATKNMFMSGLQGHATMQFFLQAGFLKVFGTSVFAIRLISAVVGTLTIPLFYLLLRRMFDRTIALLGATFLVGYAFHLHFSRVGMENVGDPFLMVAALFFAWRAARWGKTVDFVLTGLVLGLGLYLSPAARVIPLIVLALFGYTVLLRPRFLKQAIPGMGMMTLAYGAAALPVAVFWFTHHSFFMDRISIVSIYQSHWIDQQRAATGDSTLAILWDQSVHAFGGFGWFIDRGIFYRGPMPLVDHLSLLPFLLGIAYSSYRGLRDERYFLLLAMFLAVVVTGGVLTVEPPNAQRLLGTIPAVAALVAIGIKLIADAASRWRPRAGSVVAGVAIAALVTINVQYYFFQYRTGGYGSDLNNRVAAQVVDYVRTLPEDTRLFWYGAPRMYLAGSGHPAMTFPLRDRPRLDVLQDGRVGSYPPVDLTGEAPATFMFLPHREAEIQPLIDSCPGGELKTFIMPAGRHGLSGIQTTAETSFIAYQVLTPNTCLPASARPAPVPAPTAAPKAAPTPTVQAVQATALPGAEDRNSKRIQDLTMLSQLLQQYFERASSYPSTAGKIQSLCVYEQLDAGCKLKESGATLPADPLGSSLTNGYWYISDGNTFTLIAPWEGTTQPPAAFSCPATLTSVAEHSSLLCLQGKR